MSFTSPFPGERHFAVDVQWMCKISEKFASYFQNTYFRTIRNPKAGRPAFNPMQIGLQESHLGGFLRLRNATMVTKVNILIDGGFFSKRFKAQNKRVAKVNDVKQLIDDIMEAMRNKTKGETQDILFSVFYYDCKPFGGVVDDHTSKTKIDYSKSTMFQAQCKFIDEVAKLEMFALRLGELSFSGWKQDMHSKK